MQQYQRLADIIQSHAPGVAEKVTYLQSALGGINYNSGGNTEDDVNERRKLIWALAESCASQSANIFLNYLNWLKNTLASRDVPHTHLKLVLECMKGILVEELGEESRAMVLEYIDEAITQLPKNTDYSASTIKANNPHSLLAMQYLSYVLKGDKRSAYELLKDALNKNVKIQDLYLQVFQVAQYEVGRLWQLNRINVATEHRATSITRDIMNRLASEWPIPAPRPKTALATCIEGEQHQLGICMVSDFLEMNGWDVRLLGADTPNADVVEMLVKEKTDLLLVSVAMIFNTLKAQELINTVRKEPGLNNLHIMVGGSAFNEVPDLWARVDADAFAADAEEAVAKANALCAAKEKVA